jgi:hypothetical protein
LLAVEVQEGTQLMQDKAVVVVLEEFYIKPMLI